jgi:hypothetical protein
MNSGRRGLWPGVRGWLTRHSRLKSPRYVIIETERLAPLTAEDEASIASLQNHPGMLALIRKCALMRAALISQLERTKHDSIRDVDFLQSGAHWLRFLEREMVAAAKVAKRKEPRLAEDEVELFERIRAQIESVGTTSPDEI